MNKTKQNNEIINFSMYDRLVIIYFVSMTFEYISEYYAQKGNVVFKIINTSLRIFSMMFPIILILYRRPRMSLYRYYFLLVFGVITIITLGDIILNFRGNISFFFIYESLLSAFLLSRLKEDIFLEAFKKIAICSFFALVYVFIFVEIDFNLVSIRGYSWTESFFYASFFWAIIPFVLLSILKNDKIKISIFYWGGGVVFNMILLKRFIIIDSLILSIVLLIILISKKRINIQNIIKFLMITIIVLLVTIFIFNQEIEIILESILKRFNSIDSISNFDRFIETKNYLSTLTFPTLIFGKGFLGTHNGLGWLSYALHMGWGNFLLKGGIIFLIVIIIPYIKMIFLIPTINRLPIKVQFSIYMMIVYLFRLTYSNMHSFYPEMLMFFWCLITVMDYKMKGGVCK